MVERLEIAEYSLPLRRPLRGACGESPSREGFIVTLRGADGAYGRGEAAPAWWAGAEPIALVRRVLDAAAAAMTGGSDDAERLVRRAIGAGAPAVAHAIATALLDMRARREGVSVADRLAAEFVPAPPAALPAAVDVNALLVADGAAELEREAAAALAAGFTTLKLKLGGRGDDVERVAAVRRGAAGRARLRLDANRAWAADLAHSILSAVAGDDIEYVEEPLASADPADLRALAVATGCRLAADESVETEADLERLVAHAAVAAVVLKPMRIGSPARLARLAARARAAGLGVTFTDSIETAVGRTAVAHIAAALGDGASATGLGGAALLAVELEGVCPAPVPTLAVRGPGLGPGLGPSRLVGAGTAG